MRKSQCLSEREFPEFFKTLLTFDPIGFFRGLMGYFISLKKRRGLLTGAVKEILQMKFLSKKRSKMLLLTSLQPRSANLAAILNDP